MLRRVASIVLASACVSPAHALYDPAPEASLVAVQGAGSGSGSLTYRDYRRPDRMVELGAQRFTLKMEEVDAAGASPLRNTFVFGRAR